MFELLGAIVKNIGKDVITDTLTGVAETKKDELTGVLKDAVSDTIHSMVAGKETIHNWAEMAAKGIDSIIEKTVNEENLQYVGGKLIFAFSTKNTQKVDISFELYFIDSENQWHKKSSVSDVYTSTFTDESLEELRAKGIIEYEIKG